MSTPKQKEEINLNTVEQPSEQEKLVERLRSVISESGLSQAKFCKKCGLNKDKLSKILHGKASLGVQDAISISKMQSISIDYLLGLSTIKKPYETVYSLLTQHISPDVSRKLLRGKTYPIPILRLSAEFSKYLNGIWDAQCSSAPDNAKKTWKESVENEFLREFNSTPNAGHGVEYTSIPVDRFKDPQALEDMGIYPESL